MPSRILIGLVAVIMLITVCMLEAKAQDMKLIGYTETEDCKYPSTFTPVTNTTTGEIGYIVTQDGACGNEKKSIQIVLQNVWMEQYGDVMLWISTEEGDDL